MTTTNNVHKSKMGITVFYSPQPDEQSDSSAAYEYAKRTSDLLTKEHGWNIDIHRLCVDSLNSIIACDEVVTHEEKDNTSTISPTCTFIILSCSADGSVDRVIRKILRNLKNCNKSQDEGSPSSPKPNNESIAIALLGHARCDNSANQMKDTIFNYGRKFHKCIEVATTSSEINVTERLEVQVELEGPDEPGGFDEWVNKNASPDM